MKGTVEEEREGERDGRERGREGREGERGGRERGEGGRIFSMQQKMGNIHIGWGP